MEHLLDLCGRQSSTHVLLVGQYEERGSYKLLLLQKPMQLIPAQDQDSEDVLPACSRGSVMIAGRGLEGRCKLPSDWDNLAQAEG